MLEISIKAEVDLEKCIAIIMHKDKHIELAGVVRNILNDCKSKTKIDESLLVANLIWNESCLFFF